MQDTKQISHLIKRFLTDIPLGKLELPKFVPKQKISLNEDANLKNAFELQLLLNQYLSEHLGCSDYYTQQRNLVKQHIALKSSRILLLYKLL